MANTNPLASNLTLEQQKNLFGNAYLNMLWHCPTDQRFPYWVHLPDCYYDEKDPHYKLLVIIHGTGCAVEDYVRHAKELADQDHVAVLAPLFPGGLIQRDDFNSYKLLSCDGIRYDQHEANRLSTLENIIILCGHYKGIDHRIREHLVTREISIGDYVLTGGELAACIIADSVVRIIPGAIGDEASALTDSFQDNLLAPPVYTRPAEFRGWRVPDVLLSGNFAEIEKWQDEQAYERTRRLRPDLLDE